MNPLRNKYYSKFLIISSFILTFTTLGFCSCSNKGNNALPQGETLTHNSALLNMADHGSFISVTITDPNNKDKVLGNYALVNKDSGIVNVPQDMTIIKIPIKSAAIFSTVHASAFEELGCPEIIKGVADAEYFSPGFVRDGISSGRIADLGSSMSPSLERLIDISPQLMMVSYDPNISHDAIAKAGIIVIPMPDYLEPSPLGRAEWILFAGALADKLDMAKTIYKNVVHEYETIKAKTAQCQFRPEVITDMEYSGQWAQPSGGSYAAQMIGDAGGRVLFSDDPSTGSVNSDYAAVYDKGINSDFWLIRSFGALDRTKIISSNQLNGDFKAFKEGKLYYTDTSTSGFYDDIAFHPERILYDYAAILHPEIFPDKSRIHYFHPVR